MSQSLPPVDHRGSILRRLRWSMMGFGLAMGVVFPAYANFFVVWKPGMFPFFACGAVAAGIVVGLANHFMMKRILLKPLAAISGVALALRNGELRTETGIRSEDEVGRMAHDLDIAIGELQGNIQVLNESSTIAEATVSQVDLSRKGVCLDLDRMASKAYSSASDADSDLERISATSRSVDDLSRWIEELSKDLAAESSSMSALLADSRKQLELASRSNELLNEFEARMNEMELSARRVEGMAQVVAKVVRQTEVLSLNASIEAARSGEQGKGFAAVAQEIRTLAHDSAKAGSDISQQIDEMRRTMVLGVSALAALKEHVASTEALSLEVQEATVRHESSLSEKSGSARGASRKAMENSKGILESADLIRKLAGELHGMDQDARSSIRNLTRMSDDFETLGSRVRELKSLAGRFRT